MPRYGLSISIDLEKIEKDRIKLAKNGKKYLNVQSFIDTENEGKYGDHGFITQQKRQDEGHDVKLPICGNVKIFWSEGTDKWEDLPEKKKAADVDFEDTIPF